MSPPLPGVIIIGFFFPNHLNWFQMTHFNCIRIYILFDGWWGWTFFSVFKSVISQTQKLLVRRNLEVIHLFPFVCFVFIFLPVYLLPDASYQHCIVFLLASHLIQGNQEISLPALRMSTIFYDPSIWNLILVEFSLLSWLWAGCHGIALRPMGNYSSAVLTVLSF